MIKPGEAMNRARQLAMGKVPLARIDYLDQHGNSGARGIAVSLVRLTFEDFEGKEIVELTPREMSMLKDVSFTLKQASETP